jgi:uncharacterized repeat protein (TIGR01451 family)
LCDQPGATGTLSNTATVKTTIQMYVDLAGDGAAFNFTNGAFPAAPPAANDALLVFEPVHTDGVAAAVQGAWQKWTITQGAGLWWDIRNNAATNSPCSGGCRTLAQIVAAFPNARAYGSTPAQQAAPIGGNTVVGGIYNGLLFASGAAGGTPWTNHQGNVDAVTFAVEGQFATTYDFEAAPIADLAITKTNGTATSTPGGSTTYTIVASNAGPDPVTGATVADTFPASLSCTWTCVGAGGGTCAASGSGNINQSVNLPAGGSATFTATCAISAAATGTLSNTATIASFATDPSAANNSATDSDTLTPSANLAITKTNGTTSSTPGGSTTYTIVASNAGPSNANGSTVADTFPASLSCTWSCVGAGGGTCTASGSGNINDTVNLPSGGSTTYTASCAINPSATGTLSNTATVAAPGGVTDPSLGNNSATDSDTLAPSADLAVTKTNGTTSSTPGGSTTYTIVASNTGPSNASGATVADTFPASLTCTWSCVGAGGGTCTASGSGNINDTVNLPSGASTTYTASCTISAGATGTLSNTATVGAPGGVTDPTPGNNSATDSDTLNPQAELSITKTDGATNVNAGTSTTYTITASNAGPSNVPAATVADTFPAFCVSPSWTCAGAGGGTCTASGSGNINESVNLPAGGSVSFSATCPINSTATGTLSNTATVASSATDPNPGNNSASDNQRQRQRGGQLRPGASASPKAASPMAFTVTLSNPVQSGVTLTLNSGQRHRRRGRLHARSAARTVSFPANSAASQTVNVVIANDALDEDDETFTLTLSGLTATGNVTPRHRDATGTILDDDATPTLSITSPSQPEGNAGTSTMNFVVSLSAVSGRDVSFTRATADGTQRWPTTTTWRSPPAACRSRPARPASPSR